MRELAAAVEATIAAGEDRLDGSFSGLENSFWCNVPNKDGTVQFAITVDPERARCLRISATEIAGKRVREPRRISAVAMARPTDGSQAGAVREMAACVLHVAEETFPMEEAFLGRLRMGLEGLDASAGTGGGS
jgi:hypothetical protein